MNNYPNNYLNKFKILCMHLNHSAVNKHCKTIEILAKFKRELLLHIQLINLIIKTRIQNKTLYNKRSSKN